MKKILLVALIVNLLMLELVAQNSFNELSGNRKELVFTFSVDAVSPKLINTLSRIISIDKVDGNEVTAYANQSEFEKFQQLDIDYQVVTPPSMLQQPKMLTVPVNRGLNEWDAYPSWEAYVAIMQQFASDFPDLCELVSIGNSTNGKPLYFIHINNHIGVDQNEPQFMYTSSMHGDEVTGYVLMLRYIDYLLNNYGVDTRITSLVDNIDIWINPLANPDGTFAGGNSTVYGATRSNANGVDLNRNYADPEDGPHPDGNAYQPETLAFMEFAENNHFVMSSNMHGGAEVINYPWDTWPRLAADNDWWVFVCREYADTAHVNSPSGYLNDLENGITNGYAWYTTSGCRQDYMNYFHNCREMTLEYSNQKTPPANQLPDFWEYNYRSLLKYMDQSIYGLNGIVTNELTSEPIEAKVTMDGWDIDNSWVFSGLPVGDYHRPLKTGSYSVTYSALGYFPETYNVTINDLQTTTLDVQLMPITSLTADFSANRTILGINSVIDFTSESFGADIVSWSWSFEGGTPETSSLENPVGIGYSAPGIYNVELTITDLSGETDTKVKEGYIQVYEAVNMADGDMTTCDVLFYDAGGPLSSYGNNQDYTYTFYPVTSEKVIKVEFLDFILEFQDDCNYDYLEIFNGSDVSAPLIGTWCGTDSPGTLLSSNESGALTFHFFSDNSEFRLGWTALISCDSNVGVIEKLEKPVAIFPNPANEMLQIELSYTGDSYVILTDMTGKKVFGMRTTENIILIPVGSFSKGMYLLSVISSNQKWTEKIIIE